MACRSGAAHAPRVTTATHRPDYVHFPSAADPGGVALRKALLLPPRPRRQIDGHALLAAASGLTLCAGVLRALAG